MGKKMKTKHVSLFVIIGLIVFSIFACMIFVPMLWAVFTSFKAKNDFDSNFFGLPQKWVLTNYETAFKFFRVQNRDTNNVPVYIPEMLLNIAWIIVVAKTEFVTFPIYPRAIPITAV